MNEERIENGRKHDSMPDVVQTEISTGQPADSSEPVALPAVEAEAVTTRTTRSPGTDRTAATQPPPQPPLTAARPATGMTPSQRRGCIFTLLGSLLGSMGGALLALTLLALLNEGTVRFVTDNGRLRREIEALQQTQTTLVAQVITAEAQQNGISAQVNTTAQQLATLQPAFAAAVAQQATAQAEVHKLETVVGEMATQIATLSDQVEQASAAAERLQTFLAGLRSLLIQLEGAPTSPAATATDMPTATAVAPGNATLTPPTGTSSPTPLTTGTPTPSPTLSPTRTPRPTATPIR